MTNENPASDLPGPGKSAPSEILRPKLSRPKLFQRNRRIVSAYKAGSTLEDIGKEHGLSHVRIIQILADYGVDRRPRGGYFPRRVPMTDGSASLSM